MWNNLSTNALRIVLIAVSVLHVCFAGIKGIAAQPQEFDLRLADGRTPLEGRLEVYHNGSFWSVCDDRFADAAARVVCRQLGLSGGSAICCGAFGEGSLPMGLDEVWCRGSEARLEQCGHNEWGDHDCYPTDVVGVQCSGELEGQSPGPASTVPPPPPARSGDVRLSGGSSPYEGQLEVFHDGVFGSVCDDRFTDAAARVVCRQLGLSGGSALCCGAFGAGSGPMLLDEVVCAGNETRLEQCRRNGWGQHDCEPAEAVGVRCSGVLGTSGDGGAGSPPPPLDVAGRNLTVAPALQCLAVPSNVTIGTCDPASFPPRQLLYYGHWSLSTHVTYRLVYGYADGSRSCPAPLVVSSHTSQGGPELFMMLLQQRSIPFSPVVVVQRRGYLSTVKNVGPDWLGNTWVDAYSFNPSGVKYKYYIDLNLYYNASQGTLTAPGPAVAGWRWKYGSSGLTDAYLPSTSPELTATTTGAGINTTYQLVYQLRLGYFSFPDPRRFTVTHFAASTPLLLYVQLQSGVHPADMVAILLQRVEGDSVWTVGSLGADAPEVQSGQRGLFFRDVTSRATWGCAPAPSPQAVSTRQDDSARTPAIQGMSAEATTASILDASAVQKASAVSALAVQAPAPVPSVTCRLVMQDLAPLLHNGAAPTNNGTGAAEAASVGSVELECWGDESSGSAAVEVGRRLAPFLTVSGITAMPAGDSSNSLYNASADNHWGVTFSGVNLTLVDSLVVNVPLSPYGPLIGCRNCEEVAFRNVTLRSLQPLSNAAASNVLVHGAVAVSGVSNAVLTDTRCSGVGGAHGWGCLLLLMTDSRGASGPFVNVTRCTMEGNAAVPAPSSATAATYLMYELQRQVFSSGAGAITILDNAFFAAGGTTATGGLTVHFDRSSLLNNTGGVGGALSISMRMEELLLTRSAMYGNAALVGGAAYLAANTTRLVLRQQSAVDNNTATDYAGGAVYVGGAIGSIILEDRSSMSANSATKGGGGAVCAVLAVGSVTLLAGSSADRNHATGGNGGFLLADGGDKLSSSGTAVWVDGGSSMSDNYADNGGALFAYALRNFTISDRSRVDRNRAVTRGGVVMLKWIAISDDYFRQRNINVVTITRNSSMSYNLAWYTAGVVWLPHYSTLWAFEVTENSRFEYNWADSAPAGIFGYDIGYIHISSNSSVAFNEANWDDMGGAVWRAINTIGTLHVDDGGRVYENTLRTRGNGGVLQTPTLNGVILRDRGTVVANNSVYGGNGGFVAADTLGFLEVSGGASLSGNRAINGSGGALAVSNNLQKLDILGGVVSGNTAAIDGGAVYVGQDLAGNALVTDGAVVDGNTAVDGSGGFLAVERALSGYVWVLNGSRMCGNAAGLAGGAVFVRETIFDGFHVTENSTACDNVAETGDGGALYIGFGADRLQVRAGSTLTNNSAAGWGGAVYVGKPLTNVTITIGSHVAGNRAGADGGALYADAISNLVVTAGSAASGNAAGGDGGFACAARVTNLRIAASDASGNTAGGSGGLISVQAPLDSLLVSSSNVSGNVAERGAGGVLSIAIPQPGSPLLANAARTGQADYSIVDGCTVDGNRAYLDGGAISVAAQPASDPVSAPSNVPTIALTVSIRDSRFTSNYAGGAGGVLSLSSPSAGALSASVVVTNATFTGNAAGSQKFSLGSTTSSGYGGAISVVSTPKFRADAVMAAAVERPSAAAAPPPLGGAGTTAGASGVSSVSLDSECALRLEQVTFTANRAEGSGGAVAAVSCPTVVVNCTFEANTAELSGGGLAAMVESVLLTDITKAELPQGQGEAGSGSTDAATVRRRTRLQQLEPTDNGGDGTNGEEAEPHLAWWLDVVNSTFTGNSALFESGGGLYTEVAAGAGSRVSGCVFHSNMASDYNGGGVCLVARGSGAQAVIAGDTQLLNNTAARQGGGVYAMLDGGTGNMLTMDTAHLSGNSATEGGAAYVLSAAGSQAQLSNVTAEANTAHFYGGACFVQCAATQGSVPACGTEPLMLVRDSNLTDNTVTYGDGGALYAWTGASVAVQDSWLTGNRAARLGGSVAAVGCESLTVAGGSIGGGTAGSHGGGLFTQSCARVLLQGLALEGNRAATGGGAFFAGPSDDNSNVTVTVDTPAASFAVMMLGATVARNEANASDDAASGYRRFGGHGGGLFAYGNVSVLVSDTELAANNSALVGAAVGSAQRCADPQAGREALQALAALNRTSGVRAQEWELLASAGAAHGCWPLLLSQVLLPPREVLPVWLQDPTASSLQAQCGHAAANTSSAVTAEECGHSDPALLRTCALLRTLAACTPGDDDTETRLYAGSGRLEGALLDVAPTHMRLESFPGALRPGTPLSVSVRLYNGLGQPVQRDTLSVTVTVRIEPADPASGANGSESQLAAKPQRPWQDANIAYLDPGAATGGSLTAPVKGGLATWPYLTARGWPGSYVLVFTANGTEDSGLYKIAPLRVATQLLHCQAGEALDTSWAQLAGAQPSWLSCQRCGRGRFTLWRDDRPALWDVNATDYRQYMQGWASSAAEGDAACLSCTSHATCPGGAVIVPDEGYWHSAPDSALFHRCPNEEACSEGGEGDGWASLPPVSPSDLQVAIGSDGAILLTNITSNSSEADGAVTHATQSTAASAADTRSGWLSLCQALGYQAMSSYNYSNSSLGLGATVASTDLTSLGDLVAACTATTTAASYLQLECATGYTSHLCAACTPGYFINAEFECRACPKARTNIALAILSFLGGVALVLYTSLTNLKENYAVMQQAANSIAAEETSPSDFLKVAIVHAQYYIIITRLPVAYPDVISRLSGAVSAATGAESTVAFSYSCLFPGQASNGQARDQLLGALIVPVIVVVTSIVIWALRYMFFNRAKMRRVGNFRGKASSRQATAAAAAVAAMSFAEDDYGQADEPDQEASGTDIGAYTDEEQTSTLRVDTPKTNAASFANAGAAGPTLSARTQPAPGRSPRAKAAIARVRQALSGSLQRSSLMQILTMLDNSMSLRQQLGILWMIAVFILYPSWAQAALSVFACYLIDDGISGPFPDRQQAAWRYGYWIRDMAQECYAGTHLRLYVPIGIVSVSVFCLAPPLASFAVLWLNRRKLKEPRMQQRYGFLYSRYKSRYFWWESVLMLEELALVAVEVFGRALPVVSHQILLMLAAFIVLSLINMACSPVRSRTIVLLEFISMGVLSLTVTLSLFFVVSDNLGTEAANVVGLIIMIINIVLLAGFMALVLRSSWSAVSSRSATVARSLRKQVTSWARRRRRMAASSRSAAHAAAAVPPAAAAAAAEGKPSANWSGDAAGAGVAGKGWAEKGQIVGGATGSGVGRRETPGLHAGAPHDNDAEAPHWQITVERPSAREGNCHVAISVEQEQGRALPNMP